MVPHPFLAVLRLNSVGNVFVKHFRGQDVAVPPHLNKPAGGTRASKWVLHSRLEVHNATKLQAGHLDIWGGATGSVSQCHKSLGSGT